METDMDILFKPGEFETIQKKYPNTICIFVQLAKRSNLPPLDKHKYIVPKTTTVGQFLFILRKRMKLSADKAIFIFINDALPSSSQTIAEVYSTNKSSDGALRIIVTSESVFGYLN
jgi:GABA(A) receptor-associated protein